MRGEFVGDGIPRTAGGHPYNPLAGGYTFDDDCYWESCTELREIRDFAVWHMVSPYAVWIGNGVLDRFLEDESLFGEFLRTPVSEGGVEPLVVEPPHVVVEVGA